MCFLKLNQHFSSFKLIVEKENKQKISHFHVISAEFVVPVHLAFEYNTIFSPSVLVSFAAMECIKNVKRSVHMNTKLKYLPRRIMEKPKLNVPFSYIHILHSCMMSATNGDHLFFSVPNTGKV